MLDYGTEGAVIRDGQPKPVTVTIFNRYKKIQSNLTIHWYLPDSGWRVDPSPDGYALSFGWRASQPLKFEYTLTADATHKIDEPRGARDHH